MPYESHPIADTPSDEVPIWRYMSFTKLMALVTSRRLHFSRADQLGDPFEGSIPIATSYDTEYFDESGNYTQTIPYEEKDPDDQDLWADVHQQSVREVFINCWYSYPHDSPAMWAIYASPADGVAIGSTVGRLRSSLASASQRIYVGRVEYLDYERDNPGYFRNMLQPFFIKRRGFDHEHEVRALFTKDREADEQPLGISAIVDLVVLIEQIVIAPQAQQWFVDLVQEVTEHYGVSVTPTYSPLNSAPNWRS